MHLRDPFVPFLLVGLIIEIFGAFILAAEAIGLNRLRLWRAYLRSGRRFIRRGRGEDYSKIPIWVMVWGSTWGIIASILISPPNDTYGTRIVVGLVAYFLSVVWATLAMLASLQSAIKFLLIIEQRTERKATGVVGFVGLLIGFILQFIGTLGPFILDNLN